MSRFDLHIKVSEDGKVMIGGVKKRGEKSRHFDM
jgi:hypothetical protein